jgi:hypothetical protein
MAMLGKVLAVVLITLAVLPFTAPFATYDLALVDAIHQASDFVSAAKVTQHVAAIPAPRSRGVSVEGAERLHIRSAVFFSNPGEARSLVLRL